MPNYQIAFMLETTGEFEIAETFTAANDSAANAWAESQEPRFREQYDNDGWYVLDESGRNINDGIDG